ncbi:MAG: FkbM family methyltransferase [Armatimonadetes bacterium]|nr:FkbM family methyltransferase [Armatimonadota bacterium]
MKLGIFSPSSLYRRVTRLGPEILRARKVGWDWRTVRQVALLGDGHLDFFLGPRIGLWRLSEEDGCWRIRFFGQDVFFDVPEGALPMRVARGILRTWRDVYWLDQYRASEVLTPGAVVFDIGASAGIFTLLASRLVGGGGRVISCEPVDGNFRCLERNLAVRKVSNVVLRPCAVGAADGELTINLSTTNPGAHSAVRASAGESVVVPMRSLDGLVAELGLERVDFIKADVEGMEPEVLRGAAGTIRRFRPCVSMSAYHLPEHRTLLPQMLHEIEPSYRCEVRKAFKGAELNFFAWVPRH